MIQIWITDKWNVRSKEMKIKKMTRLKRKNI